MIRNAFKTAAGALLGLLIVAGVAVALTVTTSVFTLNLFHQTIQADSASVVVSQGFQLAPANAAAAGASSGTAVEAAAGDPAVNNAISAGNWMWVFTIDESSVAAWDAAATYTVTVYGDNVLLATLYVKNATPDNVTAEGVTVKVDVGSAVPVPDGIDIQVQKTS